MPSRISPGSAATSLLYGTRRTLRPIPSARRDHARLRLPPVLGRWAATATCMRCKISRRIEDELQRLDKMKKHNDGIRQNSDGLAEEIRKGQRQLDLLLRKAKSTLSALTLNYTMKPPSGQTRSHCRLSPTLPQSPRLMPCPIRLATGSSAH